MEKEIQVASADTLATLNKSEIDQQIATAHKFPRSLKTFRDEAMQLATLNENVAAECVYSLPRAGKNIEGPSARFAEILISSWGNCRAGARVVQEQTDFVIAQGIFHDLEKNSAITYEVKRRIVDKNGVRYGADMIAVTANAACSIALRNAALKGVPKALWSDIYDATRRVIMGSVETLANRKAKMFEYLTRYGVTEEITCRFLGIEGAADITLDHMVNLRGLANALKEGETTVEKIVAELDGTAGAPPGTTKETQELNERVKGEAASQEKAQAEGEQQPAAEEQQEQSQEPSSGPGLAAGDMLLLANGADSLEGLDEVEDMARELDGRSKESKDVAAAIEKRRAELQKAAE